jgi:long-chain acyl-CoA synthetase
MQMKTIERTRSIPALASLDDAVGAGNFLDHVLDAAADPHAPALYFSSTLRLPDGSETSSLSLAQLDDLATRLAGAYQSLGLRSTEPVALFFEESVAYFIHYLALNRIGAIPTFVNSAMAPDIAAQFAARVRATLMVADATRLSACRSRPELLGDVRLLDVADLTFDRKQFATHRYIHQPEDPVLLAHTSGTTGIPKAVQFNHHGFFYGVRKQLNKPMGARALCSLSASHASCVSILMSMLLRDAPVLLQTDRDPEAMAQAIETFRPELFAAFSKYFVDLCRIDLEAHDLSSVSWWLSTGDASHEPHIRRLVSQGSHLSNGERVKGSMFIDNFGSSEFGFAVFRNIHSSKTNNYGRCIGKAFDWVDVALLDECGLPVPQGEVGLLGVRAPCVTAGYWNDSNMTQRMRHGGYWLTGDYAYLGEDGAYYHVDRTPDRILVSGTAIYSTEIEERLLSRMPEIFDCTVVAARRDDREALTLFFEPRASDADVESILSRANDWMAAFGYPIFDEAQLQSAHEHVGVTGKKLKRVLREFDR